MLSTFDGYSAARSNVVMSSNLFLITVEHWSGSVVHSCASLDAARFGASDSSEHHLSGSLPHRYSLHYRRTGNS